MSADFDCPYCGEPFEVCHDDGHGYDEMRLHHDQCRACNKRFVFDTSISISHDAYRADCLNAGEHPWAPTKTYPKEYTRMHCPDCGEERKPTPEEMAAVMAAQQGEGGAA